MAKYEVTTVTGKVFTITETDNNRAIVTGDIFGDKGVEIYNDITLGVGMPCKCEITYSELNGNRAGKGFIISKVANIKNIENRENVLESAVREIEDDAVKNPTLKTIWERATQNLKYNDDKVKEMMNEIEKKKNDNRGGDDGVPSGQFTYAESHRRYEEKNEKSRDDDKPERHEDNSTEDRNKEHLRRMAALKNLEANLDKSRDDDEFAL